MPQSVLHRALLTLFLGFVTVSSAQTTFTESAAAYGLNIGTGKDGGHAWSDFDQDGDIDVLVAVNSTSVRNYLMQNNGLGTFTNVQATLAPGMLNKRAERQIAWGDLNNDGLPDFMMGSHGNNNNDPALQIFIQNASGTFGDGAGGTAPITVGRVGWTININPINAEGAGFFDFEGDGDLDIFFDSHAYGIELLRNNYIDHTTHTIVNPPAAGLFTHITTGNGPGVVQFGLNQFATDGDFGTAADADDDGWVDIFMRKRDENDFFLNQGGTFASGADLAQADNGNKGGNGLWDLDNDGDLDAVWTENGLTQIFRNDGPGVWTALGSGVFPGLPQPTNTDRGTSSNRIDALAGGDIDNDGDIDVILVGTSRSYLYINQLNSPTPAPGVVGSGAPMTFTLDPQTFNTRDGEGTTMVDVDDDGDLDIYMNINHSSGNQLWINNLPAANRNNHLIVNVREDRAPDGSTGGFSGRIALGTNVLIRDCDGNIVSGLRQVNGVFGHGNQQPELVHFGLPLGEAQTYLIEVHYPNFYDPVNGFTRLVATGVAQPALILGTNHYTLTTTDAESLENVNAPIANDDLEIVPYGMTVNVNISLFDNDFEPDGDAFSIESITQPAVGTVTIVDANAGIVNYSYAAGTAFPGTAFTYTITDSTTLLCPASGKSDTATVTIYEPCADSAGPDSDGDGINDTCDLDDDNDGILDCTESDDSLNSYFAWNLNNPAGNLSMETFGDPDVNNWLLSGTGDYSWNGITASASGSSISITNMPSATLAEAIYNDDYIEVSFTTDPDVIDPELSNITWGWFTPSQGDSYTMSFLLSDDAFTSYEITAKDVTITDDGSSYAVFDLLDDASFKLKPNTTYTARAYVYNQVDDSPQNFSVFDDLRFNVSACEGVDTDSDSTLDHLDSDSDGDNCGDADEAYGDPNTDGDDNGMYGTGSPAVDTDGTVTAASYPTPADADSNGTPDHQQAGTAPSISVQPVNATTCPGCNATFSVTASNADTYQWQIFNGSSWVDLTDSGIHSGTSTTTLTITNATPADNGNQYRVIVSNTMYICTTVTSNVAILTVSVNTVITNRRITYRVNKN